MDRKKPQKLLKTIESCNVSYSSIAFKAGMDLSRFSRICNGWVVPNDRDKKRIARALKCKPEELFPKQ